MSVDYGDLRIPQRIWDRVYPEPNTGCWLWGGVTNHRGYGQTSSERKTRPVHRVIYEATVGCVTGLDVDHLCSVRACCNPDHLEAVTHQENTIRANRKTHCPQGHELTGSNVYSKQNEHARRCRVCFLAQKCAENRRRRAKRKATAQ